MKAMTGIHWHPYHGGARGTKVPGDPTTWKTWRGLTWFLRRFVWKKAIVLRPEVSPGTRYRIGFRNAWGDAFVADQMSVHERFAMRIGREGCAFFALNRHGEVEIPLHVVAIAPLNDPHYRDVPLY